jgi:Sulphur transport
LSGYTIFGGLMLGLGAYVNGACVFGSVARLGSGEAGFLVTPLGFFLGIKLFEGAVAFQPMRLSQTAIGAVQLPFLLLAAFSLYALARLFRIAWTALRRARPQNAVAPWDPHEATLVIGLTFAVMLLAVGRWTYPELLSDLALGELSGTVWRSALFVALLCGARLGGLVHGKIGWVSPTTRRIATCLVGGAMMGIGSASVPGGNDGLVLIGLPFLMPYALVALATMVVAIGLTIWGQRRFARPA